MRDVIAVQDGIVSSGNSLGYSKEDMELMVQHGVAVKEMEAAAIAWAAHLFATPFLALKAITDIVDGALCLPSSALRPRHCRPGFQASGQCDCPFSAHQLMVSQTVCCVLVRCRVSIICPRGSLLVRSQRIWQLAKA